MSDLHQVAIAAVGQAKVEDQRTRFAEGRLIGDIERTLKRYWPNAGVDETVEAVKAHYAGSDEVVTGEAICALIRRARQARFIAEQDVRDQVAAVGLREQMAADRKAYESWPCEDCGAQPKAPCINPITTKPYRYLPGHLSRIRQAQGAAQ